jgi:hypothetical protein
MLDNKSIDWRIYYADGSTFDSSDGTPWDVKPHGIQIILQRHHDPCEAAFLVWMKDYYVWKHNRWFAVDNDGLRLYLFVENHPHHKMCMAGQTVDNETWDLLYKTVKADKDFFG